MKKLFSPLLLTIIPLLVFSQNREDKFIVKGNVDNFEGKTIYLTVWKGANTTNSEIAVENGTFTYEGVTDEAMVVRFYFRDQKVNKVIGRGTLPVKSTNAWCVVYPGAKIELKGKLTDFPEVYATDKYENKTFSKFLKSYFPLTNESANIEVKIGTDKTLTKDAVADMRAEQAKINDKAMSMLKEYIRENVSSYGGLWFIDDMMLRKQLSPEEAKDIISKVDAKYKNSSFYKVIEARVNSSKYAVGNKIDNMVSKLTLDGTVFDISKYRGKFILIDFWGSWCGPCMQGMPNIKALRDKYSDKLVVLGIAKDKEELWRGAIKSANLDWEHILNGDGDENFVAKFNITGYPTKILISPEGEIIYRSTGEDASSYEKFESFILNKK